MNDPVSVWSAILTLLPLVGAGGVTAIVVAYLGYRGQKERKPSVGPEGMVTIAGGLAERDLVEREIAQFERLHNVSERLIGAIERLIDEMRSTRRAYEDRP